MDHFPDDIGNAVHDVLSCDDTNPDIRESDGSIRGLAELVRQVSGKLSYACRLSHEEPCRKENAVDSSVDDLAQVVHPPRHTTRRWPLLSTSLRGFLGRQL